MKVKVNLDITMHIPGEFQDDDLAIQMINRVLREQLYVGIEFDDDDDILPIDELNIKTYKVIAGRIQNA